jgi:caspase domain-containing protein
LSVASLGVVAQRDLGGASIPAAHGVAGAVTPLGLPAAALPVDTTTPSSTTTVGASAPGGSRSIRRVSLAIDPSGQGGGGGVWGVSIGVNRYANGHNLNDADNDADAMDHALALYGVPAAQRIELRDQPASAIATAVRWLDARAGPDAVAVFFFAGHVDRLAKGASLMGSDDQGVSAGELAGLLRGLPARRAWITIAGCFAGAFTPVLAPGRVLTAASSASQVSYESPAMARSYLVEYMVQQAMVDGQASASVEDAFAYAQRQIHRDYPGREPLQWDDGPGPLSLGPPIPLSPLPAGTPGGPPPPPPSPPWTPAPTTTTTTTETCSYWTDGVVHCH